MAAESPRVALGAQSTSATTARQPAYHMGWVGRGGQILTPDPDPYHMGWGGAQIPTPNPDHSLAREVWWNRWRDRCFVLQLFRGEQQVQASMLAHPDTGLRL